MARTARDRDGRRAGRRPADTDDHRRPPDAGPGVYEVRWTTVTADDDGVERGTFTFTVAAADPSLDARGEPRPEARRAGTPPAAAAAPTPRLAVRPTPCRPAAGRLGDLLVPIVGARRRPRRRRGRARCAGAGDPRAGAGRPGGRRRGDPAGCSSSWRSSPLARSAPAATRGGRRPASWSPSTRPAGEVTGFTLRTQQGETIAFVIGDARGRRRGVRRLAPRRARRHPPADRGRVPRGERGQRRRTGWSTRRGRRPPHEALAGGGRLAGARRRRRRSLALPARLSGTS